MTEWNVFDATMMKTLAISKSLFKMREKSRSSRGYGRFNGNFLANKIQANRITTLDASICPTLIFLISFPIQCIRRYLQI